MDIPLKIFLLCTHDSLIQNGCVASYLYDPSLMKGKGTEITASETSPVAGEAEFNLRKRGDSAFFVIARVPRPLVRQSIDIIHLQLCQWKRRRILNHISLCPIVFRQYPAVKRVCVAVLNRKTPGISQRFFLHFAIRRQDTWIF